MRNDESLLQDSLIDKRLLSSFRHALNRNPVPRLAGFQRPLASNFPRTLEVALDKAKRAEDLEAGAGIYNIHALMLCLAGRKMLSLL